VIAVAACAVSAAFIFFAFAALQHLGDENPDSSRVAYVIVGGIFLVLAALAALTALLTLSDHGRGMWIAVAVVALVAAAVPYYVIVGETLAWPMHALALGLLLLTIVKVFRAPVR
jgi:hypothetical protein